jgi:hypothetical protein
MSKPVKRYLALFALVLLPLMGQANNQREQHPHKPPVLTTTTIIEIYEGDDPAKAWLVKLEDIAWDELAFDHALVLKNDSSCKTGIKDLSIPNP